jgi:hypothetical protein
MSKLFLLSLCRHRADPTREAAYIFSLKLSEDDTSDSVGLFEVTSEFGKDLII